MTIVSWVIVAALAIVAFNLFALYRHGVTERNQLTYYIGVLLLDDSMRAAHKQSLERFLLDSKHTSAQGLSTSVLLALSKMANVLAAHDQKVPAALAFSAVVWNRKQSLESQSAPSGRPNK